ncbi:MAG: hypothetical protein R6U91_08970 [Bacillota bacterium]
MNKHIFMDSFPVNLASFLFYRNKLYRDSLESPFYEELLDSTELKWPDIKGKGTYEVPAQTALGKLDPAFRVASWKGSDYPTIIYHHGNNERPFDNKPFVNNTFKNIFLAANPPVPANLIVVRAPHHRSFRLYMKHMGHLATFTAVMAVSTIMVENLTRYAIGKNTRVAVSGISLGGWITNLHRAFFNTANIYIPLLAGTKPADVFTYSIYRKLTAPQARNNPEALEKILDFKDKFLEVKDKNVFPLLGRYDQIIRYEKQKESYGDLHPVAAIDRGHVTASLAVDQLRSHILTHLKSY